MRIVETEGGAADKGPPMAWTDRAPRTMTTLLVGKLLCDGLGEQLCRVRNLSANGMLIEALRIPDVADMVTVELRCGQRLAGEVVWSQEGRAGIQFAAPIEVEAVLATARSTTPAARLHKAVPRAPRFAVQCPARLMCNGTPFDAVIENISQSGARLRVIGQPELDRVMTLVAPGLSPRSFSVRWRHEDGMGVAFIDMIPYAELSPWLTRLEIAH